MKLIESNNHVLVELKVNNDTTGIFIVDTGSPWSFSLNRHTNTIILNDSEISIQYKAGNDLLAMANQLTGISVDGFIGMDILRKTGLTISFAHQTLDFAEQEGNLLASLEIKSIAGQTYFTAQNIVVNGNNLRNTYIDTGACISYVAEKYLNESDCTGEPYTDSNPILGEITGYFYQAVIGNATLGSESYGHKSKVAVLPKLLEQFGFDAIIGPKCLIESETTLAPTQTISFGFSDNRITIS